MGLILEVFYNVINMLLMNVSTCGKYLPVVSPHISLLFAVELYSYIYSFMRCYIHFHTFSMEVLTQVTGVDRVAKDHPPQRNVVNPRGPSPARLQVQVTEGGQKRRGLR